MWNLTSLLSPRISHENNQCVYHSMIAKDIHYDRVAAMYIFGELNANNEIISIDVLEHRGKGGKKTSL